MITMMKKSPKEAIETFAAARGHKIERQNYMSSLKDLQQKDEKEPSIKNDGSGKCDYNRRSPYTTESRDRWEQERHNQRNGGYRHESTNRDQEQNWRSENWRARYNGYQRASYHSRDNHSTDRTHQRFDRNFRDHSSHKWQDYRRDDYDNHYAREDHDHYRSSKWRQDCEKRQDRFQDNRSRGYNQNYYQNQHHQRDETRGSYSRWRHHDNDVE
ncbi:hypothetical protein KR200_007434 [Drosophila serrata]|nr:hypothetical protein KR200_007434 [Drosophila serrata]